MLNVNLTPGGNGAFKIHVMLDGPYANSTWNGKEIAVIDVPEGAKRNATTYSVAVPAVEGLTGKHAIYLVAEGPEVKPVEAPRQFGRQPQQAPRPQGLFDLHGLGFSRNGGSCEPPVVPQVKITVDGKAVNLPSAPQYATNDNGFMDASNYQAYAPLKANSVIKATATDPAVKIEVGKVTDGRAIVTCTYKGVKKVYKLN